ncbi:MAG: DUF4271 domain-containing protein [Bacteroidetes bacterium]|nr:DUF4271 domain-containing protein [Bacteroidota bacterium]
MTSEQHIFYQHLLQKQGNDSKIIYHFSEIWLSVIILISFFLLISVLIVSRYKLFSLANAVFNKRLYAQLEREELNNNFKLYRLLLRSNYFLMAGFFLFFINHYYSIIFQNLNDLLQFTLIVFIFILFTAIKYITIQFVQKTWGGKTLFSNYLFYGNCLNDLLGVLLFAVNIAFVYFEINPLLTLTLGLTFASISYVLKLYFGAIMSLIVNKVGFLQIFLYLCAVEILPILVLIKLLIQTF